MAATCWLYYFSKFIEMLDTVSHYIIVIIWVEFTSLVYTWCWLPLSLTKNFSYVPFRSSLCWGRRIARWHFFMSTITQSCLSHGGLEFGLQQVGFPFLTSEQYFPWHECLFDVSWLIISDAHTYFQVAWGPSTPCLIVSSMLSCTHTTAWLPWVPDTRSSCGGRNTSPPFSW